MIYDEVMKNIESDNFFLKDEFWSQLQSGEYELVEREGIFSREGVAKNCRVNSRLYESSKSIDKIKAKKFYLEGANRLAEVNEELRLFEIKTNKRRFFWLYIGYESLKVLCCFEMIDTTAKDNT